MISKSVAFLVEKLELQQYEQLQSLSHHKSQLIILQDCLFVRSGAGSITRTLRSPID